MKNDLVKTIISKKIPCIILSPHQDDAVLSCGELLSQLSGKTDITIINFFTKAHKGPYTLSTKQFLKASGGITDAIELYKERRKEDEKVLSAFKAKVINFNFEDALFRKRKKGSLLGKMLAEFDHVYPTYRWHIIKNIAINDEVIEEIKGKMQIYKKEKVLIFAPYGVGNHADHKTIRKICEDLFDTYVLYSDFPYNIREDITYEATQKKNMYTIKPNMKEKSQLIQGYKTQLTGLFPNGTIPDHEEIYFIHGSL